MSATVDQLRRERVRALLPAIDSIESEELREAVIDIWVEAWISSEWQDIFEVPKGVYAGRDDIRPLIEHVNAVTDASLALAEVMQAVHGWAADRELLLVAALLHDASKVVESAPGEDGVPVASEFGELIQHGVWTAQRVLERGLGLQLAHLIVSHSPVSKTRPRQIEGLILYYADMLDSDVLSLEAGLPQWLTK